jgi:hypothetical protein
MTPVGGIAGPVAQDPPVIPSKRGGEGPQEGVTSIDPVLIMLIACHGFLAFGSLSLLKKAFFPIPRGMLFLFKRPVDFI